MRRLLPLLICLVALLPHPAASQANFVPSTPRDIHGLMIRLKGPQAVGTRSVMAGGGRLQESTLSTEVGKTWCYLQIIRYPCSSLQWEWSNTWKSGFLEAPNTNPLWIKVGAEYPENTIFPLKFNGRSYGYMGMGGTLRSDPLGVALVPIKGTVAAGATTTSIPTSDVLLFTNQTHTGCLLHFDTGANAGQELFITSTAADGSTALATFTTQQFANPPTAGDKFTIYPCIRIRTYAYIDGGTYTVDNTGATGGNFKLTFNSVQTADIAYNATPFTVEQAIQAISSVGGPANVHVTGAFPVYTVRLEPNLPVNTQALTAQAGTGLTGIAAPTVTQQNFIPVGYQTLGGGQNAPFEGRIDGDGAWTGNVSNTTTTGFGPIGLYAQPQAGAIPSFSIWGDSIITGTANPDATGSVGFFEIALNNNYPYVKLSIGGNTYGGDSNSSSNVQGFVRQDAAYGSTFAVTNMGANNVTAGTSLPALKAYAIDWQRRMKAQGSVPVFCTLIPDASSDDGYTTTTNQHPIAQESVRQGYNVWLLDKTATGAVAQMGGGVYVINVGDTLEINADGSSLIRNLDGTIANGSGHYWKTSPAVATGTFTTTGTGATSAGDNVGNKFTSGMVGKYIIDSTIHSCAYISAFVSAAQLTTTGWNNGTPSNGDTYYVVDSYTWGDGIHPSTRGDNTMATAVTAFLGTLTTIP